jgi:hypothetical protein
MNFGTETDHDHAPFIVHEILFVSQEILTW